MIGHILRKDLKILWRLVIIVALANATGRLLPFFTVTLAGGHLTGSGLFNVLGVVSTAILIGLVVQQDALPGPTPDWLVRPISRRDLLLSKLLFIVLMVQLPIFLFEIAAGLMDGVPAGPCLAAAASSGIWMLLALDLPMIAIAAVTRNIVACTAIAVAALLLFGLITGELPGATADSGIEWIASTAGLIWEFGAVLAILVLQYRGRKTIRSRWALGAAMIVLLLLQHMPWNTAFAIQERFSTKTAGAIQLAFGRAGRSPAPQYLRTVPPVSTELVTIPIEVRGMESGDLLMTDRVELRLTGPSGGTIEATPVSTNGNDERQPTYLQFTVLSDTYRRIKSQPLKLTADYWLTNMKPLRNEMVPVPGTHAWLPDVGFCATRILGNGVIIANCHPVVPTHCIIFANNGSQQDRCAPDYSPYSTDGVSRDNRIGAMTGVSGPVSRQQLIDGKFEVRAYQPTAHFTRRLEIPAIRLGDWVSGCYGPPDHCEAVDLPHWP